jgi:deoxyribodipyrimidine photo-lyase
VSSPAPVIVWLRNDLRLADNPALAAACATGRPIIPLYCLGQGVGARQMGGAARWWLDKSLASLARDISILGGRLVLRRGDSRDVLDQVISETGSGAIYWNRRYDAASIGEDRAIMQALKARGFDCRSFNAGLLNEPWDVLTAADRPYRVFSAYWRAAAPRAGRLSLVPRPGAIRGPDIEVCGEALADWDLHPSAPDWSSGFSDWSPGEAGPT